MPSIYKFKNLGFLLPIAIFILAFLLRIIPVIRQELWLDEVGSIRIVESSRWLLFDDVHPPLYYFILKIWHMISPHFLWLRLLSVLFSLGTVLVFKKIIATISTPRASYIGMLLISISAFDIHYAWQIRMYSLNLLLSALVLFFTLRLIKNLYDGHSPNQKTTLGFIIFSALGVLTTYLFSVYLLAIVMFLLSFAITRGLLSLKKILPLIPATTTILTLSFFSIFYLNILRPSIQNNLDWIPSFSAKQAIYIILFTNSLHSHLLTLPRFTVVNTMLLASLILILTKGLLTPALVRLRFGYLVAWTLSLSILAGLIFQAVFSTSIGLPRSFSFLSLLTLIPITLFANHLARPPHHPSKILPACHLLLILLANLNTTLAINFKSAYTPNGLQQVSTYIKTLDLKDYQILFIPYALEPVLSYELDLPPQTVPTLFSPTLAYSSQVSPLESLDVNRNLLIIQLTGRSSFTRNAEWQRILPHCPSRRFGKFESYSCPKNLIFRSPSRV